MKKLRILLIALLTMTIGFASASCSKKDDAAATSLESVIVGTWRLSEEGDYWEITFKSDKTFNELENVEGYAYTYDGKYSISDNLLTMNYYDNGQYADSETYTVKIVDNNRIILDDIMFSRQ